MAESKTRTTEQQRTEGQEQLTRSEARGGERGMRRRESSPILYGPFSGSAFGVMRRMAEEMDRMFDRFFEEGPLGRNLQQAGSGFWSPRVEVFQKEDKFVVRAELPGVKKEDVNIELGDDQLTIHGERREEHEEEREGYYRTERSYGSFHRAIPLPEGVIAESADASFKDGVLEVKLQAPPKEVSRGRRIEIK